MTTLFPGQSLHPGQSLESNNKLNTLIMQTDGNVVLYGNRSNPLWATNTGGLITPREFIMQTDGNLVLYSTDGRPRWASLTWNNPGAFLNVQDDGNLVVYRAGSQTETADNALWGAGSKNQPSSPGPIAYSLTTAQLALQLSALAYVDQNTNASRQQMIDAINGALNSAGHQDWAVVWGPALDPGRSNLMYVAGNNAGNQFAVAVRGTDWKFWLDWIEDFDNFLPLIQYSRYGVPVGPNVKIAQGTAIGLEVLLALNDGATDLKTFITTKTQHAQVLVTGHSLGGCLAAALAPCIATWVGAASMSVYTFAAPSPGNSDFADHYNGLFVAPTNTKPSTAFRFYNSLDVIPNAWATLPAIETYYPPLLPCPSEITAAVNFAAGKVGSEYAQLGTSTNGSAVPLPGSFIDPFNLGRAPSLISPIGDTLFLLEAGQQHLTTNYQRLLGVPMVSAAAAVLKRLAAKVRPGSVPTPISAAP